jgi:hypothetical protein
VHQSRKMAKETGKCGANCDCAAGARAHDTLHI